MIAEAPEARSLPRSLGIWAAVAVVVSNVIGSGIFLTSGFLAQDLGNPSLLLGAWLIGGVLALAGALCYGELGARLPRAGGEYVFLGNTYGSLPAFLTGWASFWVGFSAPIAAASLAFVEHLSFFSPALAVQSDAPRWLERIGPGHGVAIAVIVALALIHRRTATMGARFHVGVTAVKVGLITLLIIGGLTMGKGDVSHFRATEPIVWATAMPGLAVGLIFVMFSYSGWNAAAYIGEELKNPNRTLPLSLLLGTILIALIYMGLNVAYIYAMPLEEMKGVLRIGETAARSLFPGTAAPFLNILFMATILGSVSAMTIAGPRVYFAMARDRLLPRAVARIHPRFQTPSTAILLQAVWASLLVLSGSFAQLVTFSTVVLLVFTGWTISSLFILRKRHPEFSGYHAWGYPVTPIVFLAITSWSLVHTLIRQPWESGLGLGLCALGIPAYFIFNSLTKPAS